MDKTAKKWTALLPVKIISFVLMIVIAFVIMNRINAIFMMEDDTRISPEVVLSDLSSDWHLFDRYMSTAHYRAIQLLALRSEDAIIAGENLTWREYEDGYALFDTDRHFQYAWLDRALMFTEPPEPVYPESDTPDDHYTSQIIENSWYGGENTDTAENRIQAEQNAIREQLDTFRYSARELSEMEGLIYYLRRGTEVVLSNTGLDTDFLNQPVYLVMDTDYYFETSHDYPYGRDWVYYYGGGGSLPVADDMTAYLAFTPDAAAAYRNNYSTARDAYIRDFLIIAVSSVLALVLLVVLLLGAGRKYDAAGVHFAFIDRPFLDISLVVAASWIGIALFLAIEPIGNTIWYHQNLTAMNILFAVLSVVAIPPALLWLMSLAKRMKAGRFWRHTLIFFIPSKLLRFVIHMVKSLWVGFPLNLKVGLISLASFIALIVVGISGYASYGLGGAPVVFVVLILTAVAAFFLLRYARRIHDLERAARQTADGEYGHLISVGGGELGSIADSINNISAGINAAVEQRMKSERLKTELITNVSHDIRTPLTSIITYTDLLKHEGLSCEKAPEYLDILIQKSQRLKTLTDELFEAAKASTGNIDVNPTDLDLVSLINQVLGELDGAIKSSGLDLRLDLPESQMVRADGRLMWRVLENLLSNVFKYSLPGSRVYLSAQQDNLSVRIDLKNISATALNIDPAELTERFKRGDDARTDGGSGLGLSIVQSFVAAQGGKFGITIDGDLFKATVHLPSVGK